MAEETNETVVIQAPEDEPQKSKKLLYVIIGVGVLTFLALIVSVYFIFFTKQEKIELPHEENQSAVIGHGPRPKPMISVGDVEKMIEKAKVFYKNGEKDEALRLYEQIAQYNQSASAYNLGVAKMDDDNYEEAISYLNSAIKSGENELPALLNSAVCSLKLGKEKAFRRYLELAKNVLPRYGDNPLYSYYYALIKYYENDYFASLAAINAPTSKFYIKEQAAIAARMYLGYNDVWHTLEILKKQKEKDYYDIGLLHARLGQYQDAMDALLKARETQAQNYQTNMALELVSMKMGMMSEAVTYLGDAVREAEINASKVWPITVKLREGVFESDKSQQEIADNFLGEPRNFLGLLFYFAPYKIFSPDKTVASIKKGALGIIVNDQSAGADYLKAASRQSAANAAMIKGLEYLFDGHLVLANKVFKELEKTFPTNAVLLYNLGLSYAQLGEYKLAEKYLLKAYHYDTRNIESGVYALLISTIYGQVSEQIQNNIAEAVQKLIKEQKSPETVALYGFVIDNFQNSSDWLRSGSGFNSMNMITAVLIALRQSKQQTAIRYATELRNTNPKDLVANAVFLFVNNYKQPIKTFAFSIQEYLTKTPIDYGQIFYGPDIAGSSFVGLARISGMMPLVEQKVSQRLSLERYDRVQLLKIYSLAKLYQKLFEESYLGYSELIFKQKISSAPMLFYAGVAAIGSKHFPDAISFFEIAKMADANNAETLFALGLLYQEAGSLKNAANQYKKTPAFLESSFFDFDISNVAK